MRIDGAGALVAGGASGLGAATARRLAAGGARVTIADVNAEAGEALASELGGRFVGEAAILRFYVLHCLGFPLVAATLMAVHFWRVRKDGGLSGPL